MLEVYCWCSDQQLQAILASFPYNSTGLTAPSKTVTTSWNFSQYMLSSSVTNCYGAEQWSWQNISTTQAVSAAEQDWRASECLNIAQYLNLLHDTIRCCEHSGTVLLQGQHIASMFPCGPGQLPLV